MITKKDLQYVVKPTGGDAPSPTLITKNITENGTYSAASDNADGYSVVTVNVQNLPVTEKDVNFYDYDGTLVASYTAADFANLSAMPANPSHTRLIAQGWNWTLADAKTYVASYGKLDIGQVYATASGKTEYDIEVNEIIGMTATLGLDGTEKDWGDGTIDTLESHTYATAGSYTIKLSGTTLPYTSNSKKIVGLYIGGEVTNLQHQAAIAGCIFLKYITIPNSLRSDDWGMELGYCYSLKIINPPAHLDITSVRNDFNLEHLTRGKRTYYSATVYGFSGCSALKSINYPIDPQYHGFQQCRRISSLIIRDVSSGQAVPGIDESSFAGWSSLKNVIIPANVAVIESRAFEACVSLLTITVLATTPPRLVATNAIPSPAPGQGNAISKIYIPNGTLAAYQSATNWSSFASIFEELPAKKEE